MKDKFPFYVLAMFAGMLSPIFAGVTWVVFGLIHKVFDFMECRDFNTGLVIMMLIGFIEFIFVCIYIKYIDDKEGK